jgi:hypothetical protein
MMGIAVKRYLVEGLIWSTLWTLALMPLDIFMLPKEGVMYAILFDMEISYGMVLPLAPLINSIGSKIVKVIGRIGK